MDLSVDITNRYHRNMTDIYGIECHTYSKADDTQSRFRRRPAPTFGAEIWTVCNRLKRNVRQATKLSNFLAPLCCARKLPRG